MKFRRGEIWNVDLNPTRGTEISKIRPVVIISSDSIGVLPIKLVAPFTKWKNHFSENIWHLKVIPNEQNNLSDISAIDILQIRGIDEKRFISRIGILSQDKLKHLTYALAIVIEMQL